MPPKQLVSVVIIFLNSEKFLREAIESVFAQTYDNWELLLVDDGSTDASTQIARRYMEQYPGKVVYLEHANHVNRGMSATRNLGIHHAKGKYVALLDSDDVWLPHKLERQVAILESQPRAAILYGASQYWHSWTGNVEDMGRDHVPDLGVSSDTLYDPPSLCMLLYPLGNGTAPCPSDLLIRRDAIIQIGGFEEDFSGERQLYEDQAFLAKMYLEHSVFVSSECWDRYRIHSDSCVSVVTNAGQYESVRLFFLNWLETYLLKRSIKDERIWAALRQAMASYRQPGAAGNLNSSLRTPDCREAAWSLRLGGGNVARLVSPPRQLDLVRIEIDKLQSTAGYDVQLNWTRLRMKANASYRLHFRAKADCPRRIAFGVAQAHEPWGGLGLYKNAELTSEWQSFDEEFVALSDDPNARVLFDVGNSEIPVELVDVSLQSVSTGEAFEPNHSESAMQADSLGDPQFGQLRRLTPISSDWGWDRGLPIDRYYIEKFLAQEAASIRGHVLEIGDNSYTVRFGGSNVEKSDVLHVTEGNPMATIVADLTAAPHIPSGTFDCILLIQTLQLIYDVRSAIQTLYRILKPGGVLLVTLPGISQTYDRTWGNHWCWNFTPLSAQRLFREAFPEAHVKIESFGNVLAAISFLHGLAKEELRQAELDYYEPGYEVTIAVKAMKPLGIS